MIFSRPIEMVVQSATDGAMKIIRFRLQDHDEYYVVDKIKVIHTDKIMVDSKPAMKYRCRVIINGVHRECDIIYYIMETKWLLRM